MSENETKFPEPLRDYVMIKREQGRILNGIVIPDMAGEVHATVMAVGPGCYENGVFVKTLVSPGDKVLVDSNSVGTFRWEGETYGLIQERFLAAKLPIKDATPLEIVGPNGQRETLA